MSDVNRIKHHNESSTVKTAFCLIIRVLRLLPEKWLRWYRSKKFEIPHLFLFPSMLIYLEIVLRLFAGTGVFYRLAYPVLFAISAGLLLSAITSVWPEKINRILSIILMIAITFGYGFACIIRCNYQVYMPPATIFAVADNVVAQYGYEVFRAIFFGIPKIFVLYIPTILYCAAGRRCMPACRHAPLFAGVLVAGSLIFLLIGNIAASVGNTRTLYEGTLDYNTATDTFGLITSTRMSLFRKASSADFDLTDVNDSQADASQADDSQTDASQVNVSQADDSQVDDSQADDSCSEKETVVQTPVIYGDNVMDLDLETLMQSSDSDIASISEYVNSLTPTKKNAYTGLFEGKNLIMICAEAFSDAVIDEELTPTLYRMTHNGFYFSDAYQPEWGGSTSTGEFSLIMGLAPTRLEESVTDTQYNNNYFTMGNQLQREGYYSVAYHAGYYKYYSRNLTHENFGYGEYLATGNGLEDLVGAYASDSTLFDVTFDTYADKQPFNIYYMTASGHSIYQKSSEFVTKYYDQVKARYGNKYEEITLYYICYQMELENALTILIQKLEDAGIADDTVIAMTADHCPYGLNKSDAFKTDKNYLPDLYGYEYKYSWERERNSIIIWSECLENEYKDMACEISTPTSSLDILPTLSNLFGLEFDSRLLAGRDVFSDADPLVLWNNYCWVTERGKYDYSSDTYFPNEGYENDTDYVAQINQIVRNKLTYSDQVVVCDYYGVLFGEDTITDNSSWLPKAATGSDTTKYNSDDQLGVKF